MARRTTAAAALLALGTLAACAAPDAIAPSASSALNLQEAATSGDLPVLASARTNKTEPAHLDRGRFNITLKYAVPVTPAQQAVFEAAAARWERIIVGDVPSTEGPIPSAFAGLPPIASIVDDIIIEVALLPIDGPGGPAGNILGSAGPRYVRYVDGLPLSGVMYFDTYDLAFLDGLGLFDEVIVHEMGHVLGVGTLWNLNIPNIFTRTLRLGTVADYYFAGKYGNIHWADAGGTGNLPIENTGGAGTRGGHWRESVLRNELMTGYLNLGVNPLSRITAGSMRDLGYGAGVVGEDYTLPVTTTVATSSAAAAEGDGLDIASSESLLAPVGLVMPKQ